MALRLLEPPKNDLLLLRKPAPDPRASLSTSQKILTNPVVSKTIDILAGGLKTVGEAGERYPRGIMKTLEGLQTGKPSHPLTNIFTPTPDPRNAVQIAQEMGQRIMPKPVIQDPQSKLQYAKAFGQAALQDLPFTTAGVTTELFTNPINALLGGLASKASALPIMQKSIKAPKIIDEGIMKIIETFNPALAKDLKMGKTIESIKQIISSKRVSEFEGWKTESGKLLAKYSKPGALEAEIKSIVPEADVSKIRSEILNNWAKTVYKANVTKVPSMRLRSPKEFLTGKKGQIINPADIPKKMPGEVGKVPVVVPPVPAPPVSPLSENEQTGAGVGQVLYRGGHKYSDFEITDKGISFTLNKKIATDYKFTKSTGSVQEFILNPSAKIFKPEITIEGEQGYLMYEGKRIDKEAIVKKAREEGYDAVDFTKLHEEIRVLNPSKITPLLKPPTAPPKTTFEQPWPEELPAKSPEIQPIEDRAEMEIEMMHYSNGLHPLEKAMRDIGKIRVQAKGKEAEESRKIPSRFLSQTGRPIDERRQELENKYGIAFESDSDLRQALKELGGKQQRFLLSSDVQAYLKSKPNIEALGRKLGKKLSPAAYKRIIYSNVGLKPSKTPFASTREKMLKYTLKQREIAARGGFKAGRRELKGEQRAKKQERARQIEAGKRFPREQRYEIYKAARKAGLILYEKKDPATGQITQKYKNKLSPLLRFYKKASFDEIMGYIRALRGDPENPPLVFKISGDPIADAETMKLIAEASEGWEDINRFEIGSLDLPRIVEKVSGAEIFEDNILADNTYEVLKGADDARFERMSEELQALEDNAKEFAAETKASAELMRKFEVGENLSEKEQKAANFLRSKYDDLIKQANENRERLGKKPIPYRKDYMTHIRDWNLLTTFFKGDQKAIDNLTNEQWQALAKGQYSKISVPFNQFAQQRTGKKTKFDAIGNYKKYLETLLYEIYMSPAIKHARVFTDYALLKQPNAKIAIDNLLDELAGKPSSFDHIAIRPIVSNPVLKALNARFGANALIGNISYYIMNASNIATASGELGNYTIKGMHGFLSNSYLRQLAFKKSSLLKSRQGLFDFEISRLEAFFAGHGKDLTFWEGTKLKDKQLEYVISSINRIIEYNNVGSSWVGAYLKAIDKFKYSPEKAYKYADSVARKTQGGYRPYEMPAWMRSDTGKIISKFGTWAFNMMNYFLYDLKMANIPGNIASIITKAPKKEVHFGKFIVLAITLMFVNTVYKKMGLRKPYSPKSFVPQTPITRGRYEQPPAGRMVEDVKTLLPLEGKRKEKPSTRAKAAEELFFMLGPRYGGAQLRRLFHGDILPEQKKERKQLRLLSNN